MNRLNLITLGVKDIVKSLHFYRDGLGFDVKVIGTEESPEVVFINNDGSKISLFPLEELIKDIQSPQPISSVAGFNGITLAYNGKSKEEVDEIFVLAEKAGAIIVKKPEIVFWGGYSGYFQDPDGFYWEVAYGADWEFDDNDMLMIK